MDQTRDFTSFDKLIFMFCYSPNFRKRKDEIEFKLKDYSMSLLILFEQARFELLDFFVVTVRAPYTPRLEYFNPIFQCGL